ncbi:MAG TPA: helix-turn-helix domain-containing protein [Ktedonobacterales bacterium]
MPISTRPIKLLLTADEAAAALSIGRTLLYHLTMTGQLHSIKVGGARRFPLQSLQDYVERLRLLERVR